MIELQVVSLIVGAMLGAAAATLYLNMTYSFQKKRRRKNGRQNGTTQRPWPETRPGAPTMTLEPTTIQTSPSCTRPRTATRTP